MCPRSATRLAILFSWNTATLKLLWFLCLTLWTFTYLPHGIQHVEDPCIGTNLWTFFILSRWVYIPLAFFSALCGSLKEWWIPREWSVWSAKFSMLSSLSIIGLIIAEEATDANFICFIWLIFSFQSFMLLVSDFFP